MVKVLLRWNMKKVISMIVRILENKFDCVIVIDGNRGLGKSTLAIHLARGVAREFKKKGSENFKFNWRNTLIYTKKETKRFLNKWRSTGIADELINIAFNRDFFNEDQKDIVKMMNMNRDHCNFFISCVPSFETIDNQIKNLCKIRITVVRRGVAIIQTPNKSIYSKDKWDQKINEKIERVWISKGIKNPHYTKLTTFRGLLKFPKLSDSAEIKYQAVKDDKRNQVAKEDMGIDLENEKEKDPVAIVVKLLKEGKVRNGVFIDGYAQANGFSDTQLQSRIKTVLKREGVDHRVSSYYWEKKSKAKSEGSI
jgi:cytidylate kinase